MKIILHFLKPYRKLCVFTILAMLLDVAGGLVVPRLTSDMINIGIGSGSLDYMIRKGMAMLAVTLLAGGGALLGSWLCADLSAKIGRDMRNAVYDRSLLFSAHDFERFGTGSMITRTLNDINVIQQSVVWCIQMVLPVPAVCVMGIGMAFAIDRAMGFLLIGVTVLIIVLAVLVTSRASAIFSRLQRLLDRQCQPLVRRAGEHSFFRDQHLHCCHSLAGRRPDRSWIYEDRRYNCSDGILHSYYVLYHHGTDGDHPPAKGEGVHTENQGDSGDRAGDT